MCDTLVALNQATRTGHTILAKNSDREPDEAQAIQLVERATHASGDVACTYRSIPQVRETNACILSRPFHMWGAEMGVNEHGVAIGNEAVFTKVKIDRKYPGLTGMDLLRLALERSRTAAEALDIITSLLEAYGQDACGGYRNRSFYYHNSFLIADPEQAWVLETAGREWTAERVSSKRTISNALTIASGERESVTARSTAMQRGWQKPDQPFSFAGAYSDWFYTMMGRARNRQTCTTRLLADAAEDLSVTQLMHFLQTHNVADDHFKPGKANTGSVCMHATGLLNPSQTTGSMVAECRQGQPHTVWLTGTSMPCLSVYVPCFFGTRALETIGVPGAKADSSWWWEAEILHQRICSRYKEYRHTIQAERLALQADFLAGEQDLMGRAPEPRQLEQFTLECLQRVREARKKWLQAIS